MNVKIRSIHLINKIKRIESMIEQGIATFNGYDTVSQAMKEIARLKSELDELAPQLKEIEQNQEQKRRNEHLARHNSILDASRRYKNAYLREFGYKWRREETQASLTDFDQFSEWRSEYARYNWSLQAPDGRSVTVSQAMKEIEDIL